MKKRDKADIQNMNEEALKKKVAELRNKIRQESHDMMVKEVKNRHSVKQLRKSLAIVLTVLTQKQYEVKVNK